MAEHPFSAQIGSRVSLTGDFDVPVVLDDVRPLGANGFAGFGCRVRLPDGTIEEAVISADEAAAILGAETTAEEEAPRPADPNGLRLLVESARIRLAYAYHRQFAVSLSGIRTLPHQVEAVYVKMLPQPRPRFLLADDPGAGKTIMAGLLIKELKLREAVDRCLILVPAPLTIQWQDEMLRFFNKPFQVIHSANDQQQLLNLWGRERQVVASIDYAKQVARANLEAEERRLMPRYVESHFVSAAKAVGLRTEARADGLWRIEHVRADLRSERLAVVRRLGAPDASYRKLTFYKEHLEQDQHLDAVLLGPGHAVYAAVDEKLNELLHDVVGRTAVYVDSMTAAPYRLHFYEITVRGQTTKGEATTIHAELVAVREEAAKGVAAAGRFQPVPADVLIDLPEHPHPPETLPEIDYGPVSDYIKTTVQMERRSAARDERGGYADVARDYLQRSFHARVRAAQDRVMRLRHRESKEPEMALARQRAEQDLADLERTRQGRIAGVDRLRVARHGPARHVASCLVLPPDTAIDSFPELAEEQDAALKRRVELAAEDLVVAYEEARNRDCDQVGHLKIGFDISSLAALDAQTGYHDPVAGVRRMEVKGRRAGRPIRLTTNEWYKAQQLGDTYWLYVVWDPLENPDAVPVMVRNPARHLDYAKKEVVAAPYYDVPANAVEQAAQDQREGVA